VEQHIDTPIITNKLSLDMDVREYFGGARKFAETNYAETVNRISNTKFHEMWSKEFFTEYVWCVYVSGFRAKTVSKIFTELMLVYSSPNSPPEDHEYVKTRAMSLFANERKVDAVLKCKKMIGNEIGTVGWETFREDRLSTPELLQELPFIGPITCYHLARNIGLLQYVKPDVHLSRMAQRWGYESPQKMCDYLGQSYGLKPGIVDLILWYAASTFGTNNRSNRYD
jgi:thermostable 8-oxoguanine DNA glycosylase